jgi:hypothetical protein
MLFYTKMVIEVKVDVLTSACVCSITSGIAATILGKTDMSSGQKGVIRSKNSMSKFKSSRNGI